MPLLGFHKVNLDSGQSVLKSSKPSFWLAHPIGCCCNHYFLCCPTELDLSTILIILQSSMILDTLKNELKSHFTANKGFLPHADKNGEHFSEQNLHNGNENGEHICAETFHGDNLNPHNIDTLSCTHQSPQETQHLCLLEICLCSVGPEHQTSKIHESLTGKHIKYYNAGQVS